MGLPLLRSAGLLALCTTIGCATAVTPPAPMRGTVLERTQEPAPSAPERTRLDAESTARARVVETAKSMIGVRYRYGGSTPDGFDCSGLVRFSYERGGFPELPRSSRAQFAGTQRIGLDELVPGDLLFFRFRGRDVSHVGIYVGGGEFVHAAKTTRRVERARLDHPYWRREVGLAGRVRWPEQAAAR